MGFTAAVLDAFVAQLVASMEAHGLNSTQYATVTDTLEKYYYAGKYSMISSSANLCPDGKIYDGTYCQDIPSKPVYTKIGLVLSGPSVTMDFDCINTNIGSFVATGFSSNGARNTILFEQSCEMADHDMTNPMANHQFLFTSNLVFTNNASSIDALFNNAEASIIASLRTDLNITATASVQQCTNTDCSMTCDGVCSSASAVSLFSIVAAMLMALLF